MLEAVSAFLPIENCYEVTTTIGFCEDLCTNQVCCWHILVDPPAHCVRISDEEVHSVRRHLSASTPGSASWGDVLSSAFVSFHCSGQYNATQRSSKENKSHSFHGHLDRFREERLSSPARTARSSRNVSILSCGWPREGAANC
jgi:hypothetical protein